MKIQYARWMVLAAVFAVVTVGLLLNSQLGTLSSLGWEAIAFICPLGALESMLASKSILLRTLMVLVVVIVFVVMLGKVFCAWICPVAPLRSLREIVKKKLEKKQVLRGTLVGTTAPGRPNDTGSNPSLNYPDNTESNTSSRRPDDTESDPTHCRPERSRRTQTVDTHLQQNEINEPTTGKPELTSVCSSDCSSCATKRAKFDSRHIVLGGSLLTAAIFGFPVFCLICPIGLIFGTIIVVWQFIGADIVSISLLIFPLILVLELVVLRKWCGKFCPLGALFSLLSLPNRFVKPVVNLKKCNRAAGESCFICTEVCPEQLDPHSTHSMHECSKCGLCKDKCPTGALGFSLIQTKYTTPTH